MSRLLGYRIVLEAAEVSTNLRELPRKVDLLLTAVFERQASVSTSFMRENATWTDRTGNARNGLHAVAVHSGGGTHELVLAHSVPYGIWLEVRFAGRYAIISRSVQRAGSDIFRLLSRGLARM